MKDILDKLFDSGNWKGERGSFKEAIARKFFGRHEAELTSFLAEEEKRQSLQLEHARLREVANGIQRRVDCIATALGNAQNTDPARTLYLNLLNNCSPQRLAEVATVLAPQIVLKQFLPELLDMAKAELAGAQKALGDFERANSKTLAAIQAEKEAAEKAICEQDEQEQAEARRRHAEAETKQFDAL